MREFKVAAQPRSELGKNANHRLRAAGLVPGVLYGGKGQAIHLAVPPKDIVRILHSHTGFNTIFDLEVGSGAAETAMLRELQTDPTTSRMLHADFLRIDLTQTIEVQVPVEVRGEAKGVKLEGGILDFVNREISVRCLPDLIPDHVVVDVTELGINKAIRVADITLGEGITVIDDPSTVIVHVAVPRAEVEEAPAVPAEGVEAAAAPAEGAAAGAAGEAAPGKPGAPAGKAAAAPAAKEEKGERGRKGKE
jgi:large subunit ribosomal protein L25